MLRKFHHVAGKVLKVAIPSSHPAIYAHFGRPRLSCPPLSCVTGQLLQGSTKRLWPSLVNFVAAVAYHFCLSLPAAFTQPGDHLLHWTHLEIVLLLLMTKGKRSVLLR